MKKTDDEKTRTPKIQLQKLEKISKWRRWTIKKGYYWERRHVKNNNLLNPNMHLENYE